MADSVLLFHITDSLKDSFESEDKKRPVFYWFGDSYHSQIYGTEPGGKYFYLFIVKPDSGVKLFTRHGKGDFKSLWHDYKAYLIARKANPDKYNEPGIVFSFNTFKPLIIASFEDGFNVTAKRTDNGRQAQFSFGRLGSFTRFDKIPELVELLPELLSSVPLAEPSENESEFWAQDTINAGRMWL